MKAETVKYSSEPNIDNKTKQEIFFVRFDNNMLPDAYLSYVCEL